MLGINVKPRLPPMPTARALLGKRAKKRVKHNKGVKRQGCSGFDKCAKKRQIL